jgi:alpha-glucosidase
MNVQRESQDTTSSLTLYKRLIAYRNNSLVLKHGDYKAFDINEHIFSYKRLYKGEEILVLLNFSNTVQNISVPDLSGVIELSTQLDRDEETVNNTTKLRANEGLLIRVSHD